jgi:hypothetical protein
MTCHLSFQVYRNIKWCLSNLLASIEELVLLLLQLNSEGLQLLVLPGHHVAQLRQFPANPRTQCLMGYKIYFPTTVSVSDPDPNPVGSAFNLSLDPGSGSVFGIRIRIPDPDV